MRLRQVLWGVGAVLRLFAATLLVPILPALLMDRSLEIVFVFLLASVVAGSLGFLFEWLGQEEENLRIREGSAVVAISWLLVAAIGSFPFLLTGAIPDPLDAYFETMSGLTTTGSSLMEPPLEQYPASILFHRAFLQWLGGIGFIVLAVALLAKLTHGGIRLVQAEFLREEAGGRLHPRIGETAKLLWGVYLAFSVGVALVLFGLFLVEGLPAGTAAYESVTHTFTSISTGGFSTRTDSIGAFGLDAIHFAFVFVMILGGTNFTLHYEALRTRHWRPYLSNPEFRFYVALIAIMTLALTGILWRTGEGVYEAFRVAVFNGVSILTATGYNNANFDRWPDGARVILLLLMLTGGSVGSTAGGLKVVRVLILMKLLRREVTRLLHPKAVLPVRLGHALLGDDALKTVSAFFFAYLSIFVFSTIGMTILGMDLISGASAVAATLGNVGPGLGTVHLDYRAVPYAGRLWLALLMLIGRLEIFTFLILLMPSAWKR